MSCFHLAIPVNCLESAERFYVERLGCKTGRRDARWLDFDFFGHQLTVHLCDQPDSLTVYNDVDEHAVPARHFGVILEWQCWQQLADRLSAGGLKFYIDPTIRFAGKPGEQGTFFIQDPSRNFLEFKSFKDPSRLFATTL